MRDGKIFILTRILIIKSYLNVKLKIINLGVQIAHFKSYQEQAN